MNDGFQRHVAAGVAVARSEAREFAGALQRQRARSGHFITTSGFAEGVITFAGMIHSTIVRIDGEHLASLATEHGIWVTTAATHQGDGSTTTTSRRDDGEREDA